MSTNHFISCDILSLLIKKVLSFKAWLLLISAWVRRGYHEGLRVGPRSTESFLIASSCHFEGLNWHNLVGKIANEQGIILILLWISLHWGIFMLCAIDTKPAHLHIYPTYKWVNSIFLLYLSNTFVLFEIFYFVSLESKNYSFCYCFDI